MKTSSLGLFSLVTLLGSLSVGCATTAPPFDTMKTANVTAFRLQNFEPPPTAAPAAGAPKEAAKPAVYVPATAVRDGAVFVHLNGQAVRRAIKTGATTSQGVRIEEGLIGGEEVILNPPAELKDGGKVKIK